MNKEELIQKWLNNDLSEEELKAFQSLEEYAFYTGIVEDAQRFKAPAFNPSKTVDQLMAYQKESSVRKSTTPWYGMALKIAAAVAILLVAYLFFFGSHTTTTFSTEVAETRVLNLPDGSKVTLNAVSSLSYDPENWESNRELKLVGEALFEVTPGSDFVVNTANGEVAVLGTIFNVNARSNGLHVACYEGKVRVSAGTKNKKIAVGESVSIVEDKLTSGRVSNLKPGWINGVSRFSGQNINEVFAELERQFDVNVTTIDVNLSKKFTGAFSNKHLDSALQSITQPMNLHYTLSNDKEVIITNND